MSSVPRTVVIAQPYLPAYRIPFFQGLRRALGEAGLRLEIMVSKTSSASGDASDVVPATLLNDRLARVTGARAHFRHQLLRRVRDPDVALVVVEQAAKYTDVVPLLLQRRRPPVAIWGHGGVYTNDRRISAAVRLWMAQRAQRVFVYTNGGREFLLMHGVRDGCISVLNNTLDTQGLTDAMHKVGEDQISQFIRDNDLVPGRTALFLGRVDGEKALDFLLASVRSAASIAPGFVLLIGGSGDAVESVRQSQARGAPVRYLGRLDGHSKALAIRSADILAIPSMVGLVAVDSLVAGLPIVTREEASHGPEAEYLDHRSQSVWLPADCSPQDYGAALGELLTDGRLSAMQRACRADADKHNLDAMVRSFREGVLQTISGSP